MPNHITNIVKSRPEVIRHLIKNDGGKLNVEFSNVIPKPSSLENVCVDGTQSYVNVLFGEGGGGSLSDNYFFNRFIEDGGLKSYDDKRFENFITMLRNKREYNHTSWYDWSIENWGTKWGAYGYDIDEDDILDGVIKFDTAWSTPLPIFKAISKLYPDDDIEVKYADEDIGHNLGHFIIKDGDIENVDIFDPILFALEVKDDYDRPWYVLNPKSGKYEYNENYEEELTK